MPTSFLIIFAWQQTKCNKINSISNSLEMDMQGIYISIGLYIYIYSVYKHMNLFQDKRAAFYDLISNAVW